MSLTPLREAVVTQAQWWLDHAGQIHYAQIRPMPLGKAKAHMLPITTDCSGAVTCIYYAAGAPDPNDLAYNGQGFTGTLLSGGEAVDIGSLQPADMIICAEGDATVHVYMVLAVLDGGDYTLFSHGREEAPETLTFFEAKKLRPGQTFYGRRYLATSTRTMHRWVIVNGAGARLGRTIHPVAWAVRHPAMFRKYGVVRFLRR